MWGRVLYTPAAGWLQTPGPGWGGSQGGPKGSPRGLKPYRSGLIGPRAGAAGVHAIMGDARGPCLHLNAIP